MIRRARIGCPVISAVLLLGGCGNSESDSDRIAESTEEAAATEPASTEDNTPVLGSSAFLIEVWADNWMAVYVNGDLIGEDSVPITTERSFNAEFFTVNAELPFTVAIEAKDFKETDSGIEYIGQSKQQMGDGGVIAQITEVSTGRVVAVTDSSWSTLVIHRAPLNTDCVKDANPDETCQFESIDAPSGWADVEFEDSDWTDATEWSEAAVGPKDGYDEISWDPAANLVWGPDLEVDNTVLLRVTVKG